MTLRIFLTINALSLLVRMSTCYVVTQEHQEVFRKNQLLTSNNILVNILMTYLSKLVRRVA